MNPEVAKSRMKPTNSFAARWAEFERDVILPDNPTATEREHLRRVFYAGAFALLCAARERAESQDETACMPSGTRSRSTSPKASRPPEPGPKGGRHDNRAIDD
jgi:hypothetical protein